MTATADSTNEDRAAAGKPSLGRNASWVLTGNAVYGATQWLVLVVLAKMGQPEMVGQFAVGLSISAPVILFANLSLGTVQCTDARREFSFGEYLALRCVTTSLAIIGVMAVATGAGLGRETAFVTLAIGAAKAIDAISDIFLSLLQQRERMDAVAKTMACNGICTLVAVSCALWATGNVAVAALGSTIGSMVALLAFAVPQSVTALRSENPATVRPHDLWLRLRPTFSRRRMSALTRLALPLGVTAMLLSLSSSIPRLLLQQSKGEHDVGIFAAVASLMMIGGTITTALGQAASPRLALHYARHERAAFRALLLRLLLVAAVLGVLGLGIAFVAGGWILALLFGSEYSAHADAFALLMATAGVTYVLGFMGVAVTAMRLLRPQVPMHVVNILLLGVTCAVLIPSQGILGSCWAMFACTTLFTVGYAGLLIVGVRAFNTAARP